jgi:phosphonate transport system substrate-binding protein
MPEYNTSRTRRRFLQAAGAAGTVGLTGCLFGNGDDGGDSDNTVRFVLNPAESDVEIEKQYQPLFDYIESETDATIDATRADSYTATLQAIRNDQADIADTSPSAAIAGSDVGNVIGVRVAYGASRYFSLITTTPDSGVDELGDLQGETVSMSDILSVSGSLVPLVMLKDAGLDIGDAPDGDAVDFDVENSDHTTARDQMMERDDVAAAATGAFSTAAHVPQEQFDEMSDDFADISAEYDSVGTEEPELQLLGVSNPLPRAPLMSRSAWDADIRQDVEEAILNAEPEDLEHGDDYEGESLWFTGIAEGSLDDYEPIQQVMDELGLEFSDLS